MEEKDYLDKLIIPPSLYGRIESEVIKLYVRNKINSVPIDPFEIAINEGCELAPWSKLRKDLKAALKRDEYDGISFHYTPDHHFVIIYDDSQCIQRQKFTIMHELGHMALGHNEESKLSKECANYFAAYALAPTPLIWHFKCKSERDVQSVFDVTEKPAELRFSAYQKWRKISNFSEMETELLNLFPKRKDDS